LSLGEWVGLFASAAYRCEGGGGKFKTFLGITGEMLAMGRIETLCDILRSVTRVVFFRSDVYEIGKPASIYVVAVVFLGGHFYTPMLQYVSAPNSVFFPKA
jgi:hypothetical protein